MSGDVIRFQPAFRWPPQPGDDAEDMDRLGHICFGDEWPNMKAKLAEDAIRLPSGGTLTVTSIDRESRTITVGK